MRLRSGRACGPSVSARLTLQESMFSRMFTIMATGCLQLGQTKPVFLWRHRLFHECAASGQSLHHWSTACSARGMSRNASGVVDL